MHPLVRKLVDMDFEHDADELIGDIHKAITGGDPEISAELYVVAASIETDQDARLLALEILVLADPAHRHPETAGIVESCLSDPEPRVRFSAIGGANCLGRQQRLRLLPKIDHLRNDPDARVRRLADLFVEEANAQLDSGAKRSEPHGPETCGGEHPSEEK